MENHFSLYVTSGGSSDHLDALLLLLLLLLFLLLVCFFVSRTFDAVAVILFQDLWNEAGYFFMFCDVDFCRVLTDIVDVT